MTTSTMTRRRTLLLACCASALAMLVPAQHAAAVPRVAQAPCSSESESVQGVGGGYYISCSALLQVGGAFPGDGRRIAPPACPAGTNILGSTGTAPYNQGGFEGFLDSFRTSPATGWSVYFTSSSGWVAWDSGKISNPYELADGGAVRVGILFYNWFWGAQPARVFTYCGPPNSPRARISQTPPSGTDGEDDLDAPPDGSDVDLDGGEGDDQISGNLGDDDLMGGDGEDTIDGGAGDDYVMGGEGDDETDGGDGDDFLFDGPGDDTASGGGGNDTIQTGAGNDVASGGRGHDRLFDSKGRDRISGGAGDDIISTADRGADRIACGAGSDVVVADRRDRVDRSCERVYRRKRDARRNPPRTRNNTAPVAPSPPSAG